MYRMWLLLPLLLFSANGIFFNDWKWIDSKGDGYTGLYKDQTANYSLVSPQYPGSRYDHVASVTDDVLYIFSGNANGAPSDLWNYTFDTGEWKYISTASTYEAQQGNVGSSVSGDYIYPGRTTGGESFSLNNEFYLFGGNRKNIDGNVYRMNDMWKYNTSYGWERLDLGYDDTESSTSVDLGTPKRIGGKYDACSVLHDSTFYVGFGVNRNAYYISDLWKIELSPFPSDWTYLYPGGIISPLANTKGNYSFQSGGERPGSRRSCACFVHDDYFYVFGGFGYGTTTSKLNLGDFWKFDVSGNTWEYIDFRKSNGESYTAPSRKVDYVNTNYTYPGAHAYSEYFSFQDIFIFGSGYQSGDVWNDLWKYNVTDNRFVLIQDVGSFPSDCSPNVNSTTSIGRYAGRYRGVLVHSPSEKKIFQVMGRGISYTGTSLGRLSDLWEINDDIIIHSPICYKYAGNDLGVCGGHGSCDRYERDVCHCDPHYVKVDGVCPITNCFSVFSNDTSSTCSGRGSCLDFNYCDCDSNYYGEECNVTTCSGGFSNDSQVCASHGTCTEYDACLCNVDYFQTSTPTCLYYVDKMNGLNFNAINRLDNQITKGNTGVYETTGGYPGSRRGQWIVTDGKNRLFQYGGWGSDKNGNPGRMGDYWVYDFAKKEWILFEASTLQRVRNSKRAANYDYPGAGYIGISLFYDSHFHVISGSRYDTSLLNNRNDIFRNNGSSAIWEWVGIKNINNDATLTGVYSSNDAIMSGRRGACGVMNGSKLYISGGFSTEFLNDVWMLDLSYPMQNGYIYLWPGGENYEFGNGVGNYTTESYAQPRTRELHSCWMSQGNYYTYGGIVTVPDRLSDMWKMDLSAASGPYYWEYVFNRFPDYIGISQTRRVINFPIAPGVLESSVILSWDEDFAYLFYGRKATYSEGDIYRYDLKRQQFVVLQSRGYRNWAVVTKYFSSPSGRMQPGITHSNESVYVFGGAGDDVNGDYNHLGDFYEIKISDIERMPICNGKDFSDSCSYQKKWGYCSAYDTCVCEEYFFGIDCNVTSCHGIFTNYSSSPICDGHGKCLNYDTCDCIENYFGENCEIYVCGGIFSNETSIVCSANGNCTDFEVCTCIDNEDVVYEGKYCEIMYSKCNGSSGMVKTRDYKCSAHGVCKSNETFGESNSSCDCYDNYFGKGCDTFLCYEIWNQIYPQNSSICSGQGTCSSFNNCTCYFGYFGNECEIWECFGHLFNDTKKVCTGHGNCTSLDDCKCETNYEDKNCSIWECFGFKNNDSLNICSGHGTCISADVCVCINESLYHGSNCENWDCFLVANSDSSSCSGNGEMITNLLKPTFKPHIFALPHWDGQLISVRSSWAYTNFSIIHFHFLSRNLVSHTPTSL